MHLPVCFFAVKRTRESAQLLRQKAKFKRQGSPVERVLDILQGLKRKSESGAERENIGFMMEVIVSGDLYTVSMASSSGSQGMNAQYSTFLRDGGAKEVIRKGLSVTKALGVGKKRARFGEQQAEVVNLDGEEGGDAESDGFPLKLSAELTWVQQLISSDDVCQALEDIDSWDFNVFDLDRASNRHPILMVVLAFVRKFKLLSALPINANSLVRFLLGLEAGYKDVPFHNQVHAADVTHGTAFFMLQSAVEKHLSPLDLYCMLLGAAMHDFEHPGFNNAFLVASRHDVAIRYNDHSVLENFHISSSWKLMLDEACNPFAGFSTEQVNEARATMVYAILGTDMKYHFDHLTKFKTRLNAGAFEEPERKDTNQLLAMCMHAADVSNPAKRWELSSEWSCRVMEEFFRQGEREAELSMPVSPFMDREKTDIGKCQAGFISVLIKPFFDEWTNFLGEGARHIYANVEQNIKTWQEQGEAAIGDKAEKIHRREKWGDPPMFQSTPSKNGKKR